LNSAWNLLSERDAQLGEAGDSVYFDLKQAHSYQQQGGKPAATPVVTREPGVISPRWPLLEGRRLRPRAIG